MEKGITACANSVFEQPWWLDIVTSGNWNEALVKDGDKVLARLPYFIDRGRIVNPPLTQTLGIWIDESLQKKNVGNSQFSRQKEVIFELLGQLPKAKNIDITLDHNITYVLPFRWKGFRISPTFSYRINNLDDLDTVKFQMGKTVKKNIKAAQRSVTVVEEKDAGVMYELLSKTFARQGRKVPYKEELIYKVIENAFHNQAGRLLTTRDQEGNVHSAGFFVFDSKTCYYLLGGQDPNYKSDGSQNLLLSIAIEKASEQSLSFDFEGSMIEGIENFFRQFGGEQIINYNVSNYSLLGELNTILKPRIKRLVGYKI